MQWTQRYCWGESATGIHTHSQTLWDAWNPVPEPSAPQHLRGSCPLQMPSSARQTVVFLLELLLPSSNSTLKKPAKNQPLLGAVPNHDSRPHDTSRILLSATEEYFAQFKSGFIMSVWLVHYIIGSGFPSTGNSKLIRYKYSHFIMGKGCKERQGSTCHAGLFNGCLEKQCCGVPFEHLLQFASLLLW